VITLNEAKEGGRRPGNGREGREGGGNGGPGADSTWEWREGAARKSPTALRQTEGGRLAGDIYPATLPVGAMEIGAGKSVSFGRIKTELDLKLVYKKC